VSNSENETESTSTEGTPAEPTATPTESPSQVSTEPASTEPASSEPASASPAAASGPTTPGQRVAAQMAAKAAAKAAEKARRAEAQATQTAADEQAAVETIEAPAGPDEVELRAAEVGRLVEQSRPVLQRAALGALVVFVVAGAVLYVRGRIEVAAGKALMRGTEALSAEVGPAPEVPDGKPHFATEAARTAAARAQFQRILDEKTLGSFHLWASTRAGLGARVALAQLDVNEGKYAEALERLRAVRAEVGEDTALEAQVLELIILCRFGLDKHGEAQSDLERLARIDRARYEPTAKYLTARSLFEREQLEPAKAILVPLVQALEGEDAPALPYLGQQARALLQRIDPSAAPRAAAPAGGGLQGLEGLPPELLEQLRRQLGGAAQ
jgi:hypothetical protein